MGSACARLGTPTTTSVAANTQYAGHHDHRSDFDALFAPVNRNRITSTSSLVATATLGPPSVPSPFDGDSTGIVANAARQFSWRDPESPPWPRRRPRPKARASGLAAA